MKIYSAFKLGLDASLIFFMQAVLLGKHDNKLEVATEYSTPPAVVFKTILSSVMCYRTVIYSLGTLYKMEWEGGEWVIFRQF